MGRPVKNILNALQQKQIVLPYLENAFHSDQWPDEYNIRVDSQPYYGLEDEEGITHDVGVGDGYFHPSSHPLMPSRELYYRFHPKHNGMVINERRSLTSHMTLAGGSAMHAVIQTQLHMAKVLMKGSGLDTWAPTEHNPLVKGRWVPENPYEWEYINTEHMVRGRMDGILDHPLGQMGFEFKALDVDTPILTGNGWSTMGELVDGDDVYAPDGQLTKVTAAHPVRYGRPCYEVKFRDGQSVVADAEHLWEVNDYRGVTYTLTTQQILDRGLRISNGGYKFNVPVTHPLQAPDAELPIDPWLLGAWLGDGASSETALYCGDEDLSYMEGRLSQLGLSYKMTRGKTCWKLYVHKVRAQFTALGLLGNKHIPDIYLRASESQRRSLLAGLMDTDGSAGEHQVAIGMKNETVMRQTLQLARSLGYRCTLRAHDSNIYGRSCGPIYWVKFSSTHSVSPFDMPRKARKFDLALPGNRKIDRNSIVGVEPVPTRPTRCITVAHESSLYVVGEGFVPTHNTMNSRSFRFLDAPKEEWRCQLNLGLDAADLHKGVIVVMEMGYPFSFKEFHITRNGDLLGEIYEKFDYVRACVRDNTPPRCEHSFQSAKAKACPVGHLCWAEEE